MASKKKSKAKPEHIGDVVGRTIKRVKVEWLEARVKEAEKAAQAATTPAQHKAGLRKLRSWLGQLARARKHA